VRTPRVEFSRERLRSGSTERSPLSTPVDNELILEEVFQTVKKSYNL
jgi:hypothetical protein